jgi:hypothetical protein
VVISIIKRNHAEAKKYRCRTLVATNEPKRRTRKYIQCFVTRVGHNAAHPSSLTRIVLCPTTETMAVESRREGIANAAIIAQSFLHTYVKLDLPYRAKASGS